jgi:uncharacterized protein YegL|tara:strand:+ start:2408 stop:3091 length:684 start_codon:yes stop_codon:yes gene_type:complete
MNLKSLTINEDELANNPSPRIPICLVLDTSKSMYGAAIKELNNGVSLFMSAILDDEVTRYSAELSVITFGGVVHNVIEFGSIENQKIPKFKAYGGTLMGEAIETTLDLLDERKKEYQKAGVDYFQPWMIIMTDGRPGDNINNVITQITELIKKRKLTLFPIAIGEKADLSILSKLSPEKKPLKLKGLKFNEFFQWLSRSVSVVSQSIPGEKIELDIEGLKEWASLEI